MAHEKEESLGEYRDFLIRRLFSLTGLVPIGAYLFVHLTTNASINDSPETFQRSVYMIHSLGNFLWVVEWLFIFLPLIFHAAIGFYIIAGGLPNTSQYPYESNVRYTLQRVTGMIAAAFILWHVFHMHGWFHTEWWMNNVAANLDGGNFFPYNAASSAGLALKSFVQIAIYAIGVLACTYHLANGIWTAGITWGVWVDPPAQYRAGVACWIFGVVLSLIGLSALYGMATVDVAKAKAAEDKMYQAKVNALDIAPNPEKVSHDRKKAHEAKEQEEKEQAAEKKGTGE